MDIKQDIAIQNNVFIMLREVQLEKRCACMFTLTNVKIKLLMLINTLIYVKVHNNKY